MQATRFLVFVGCFLIVAVCFPQSNNPPATDFARLHTLEADAEATWASDMLLTDNRLTYRQEKGPTEWEAAFSYASFDIDYKPFTQFDFSGFEETLREDRFGGQLGLRHEVIERVTLLGLAGIYDGYPDYRRVWIANRFRQKYDHPDFPRIPGYKEPHPWGWSVLGGGRWEYLVDRGFAELKLGYAFDQTAPGYEDSRDDMNNYLLLRGREKLDTESLSLSSENVLWSWIRALNEFTLIHTTDREVRFSYQGSLNLALGKRLVLRNYGGITSEDPTFDAYFFGSTAEVEIIRNLLVSFTGRYYCDTGEIENSLFTSSAAPPLESNEFGVGLRYSIGPAALKLYLAAFQTNYDPIESGTAEFTYLYQDRNWTLAQIAFSVQF